MIDTQREVVGYWQDSSPTEPGFYLIEFTARDGLKTFDVLHVHDGFMTMNGKSIRTVPDLKAPSGLTLRFADIGAAKG